MSKVFISYSTQDENIAQQIHAALNRVGAEPFLASLSLQPGVNWSEEIFNNLKSAEWVFFIATQSSCSSPAVQQELGASLSQNKNIIPILIDISPSELPGWIGKHQAIDARKDSNHLHATIDAIGKKIKDNKFSSGLILGGIIGVLMALAIR
ncbi:MAG: toll/interleukin-1 receptor domain-containing protein [Methylococcales bacterium]